MTVYSPPLCQLSYREFMRKLIAQNPTLFETLPLFPACATHELGRDGSLSLCSRHGTKHRMRLYLVLPAFVAAQTISFHSNDVEDAVEIAQLTGSVGTMTLNSTATVDDRLCH